MVALKSDHKRKRSAPTSAQPARRPGPSSTKDASAGEPSRRDRKGKAPSTSHRSFLPVTSLSWKPLRLPEEATATGGTTEDDFYQGLDLDDVDGEGAYLGLQEVSGVQVIREGGVVRFAAASEPDDGRGESSQAKVKGKEGKEVKTDVVEDVAGGQAVAKSKAKSGKNPQGDKKPEKPRKQGGEKAVQGTKHDAVESPEPDKAKPSQDVVPGPSSSPMASADEELNVDWKLLSHEAEEADETDFQDTMLPAWSSLPLCTPLRRALHALNFLTPTSVQSATLAHSLPPNGRDVIGIAQTGSGKTLAYGLPILQHILDDGGRRRDRPAGPSSCSKPGSSAEAQTLRPIAALVLCPTRELAMQVTRHLQQVIRHVGGGDDEGGTTRRVALVSVTGGMSEEKQSRLLDRHGGADVIVATPGRLWDLCQSNDDLTRRVKATRFLVVDEADRMIEAGHFAEMDHILKLVRRDKSGQVEGLQSREAEEDDDERGNESEASAELRQAKAYSNASMQTFIFSATLSKHLQQNLKRARRKRLLAAAGRKKRRAGDAEVPETTLEELLARIDFRDEDPVVVDLTPERRVAEKLSECKVECLAKDKDLYLYYFLLRYPGRTLVFLNSIDGIRRLLPLLSNLGLSVNPLHSQLQQKQRLKNLERFRSGGGSQRANSVLLATDVAARGLDVEEGVDHVVHYQLPRSADAFVHRSGRTARAGKGGVSLAMMEPAEKRLWRQLCQSLGRADDIAALPVEYSFLPQLKERLELSRRIDAAAHSAAKRSHDDAWLRQLAKDAELALDSDDDDDDDDAELAGGGGGGARSTALLSKREAREQKGEVESLKAELRAMLAEPLSARGVSHRYLTSGSRRGFVQSLLHDEQNEQMLGVKRSRAEDDLARLAPSSKLSRKRHFTADARAAVI